MTPKYNVGDIVWFLRNVHEDLDLGQCPVCNGTGDIILPAPEGGTQICYCPLHTSQYRCRDGQLVYNLYHESAQQVVIDNIFIDSDGVEYGVLSFKTGSDYGDVRESELFASEAEAVAHIGQKAVAF